MTEWKRKCEKCGRWLTVKLVSIKGDISYAGKCECGHEYLYIKQGDKEIAKEEEKEEEEEEKK